MKLHCLINYINYIHITIYIIASLNYQPLNLSQAFLDLLAFAIDQKSGT